MGQCQSSAKNAVGSRKKKGGKRSKTPPPEEIVDDDDQTYSSAHLLANLDDDSGAIPSPKASATKSLLGPHQNYDDAEDENMDEMLNLKEDTGNEAGNEADKETMSERVSNPDSREGGQEEPPEEQRHESSEAECFETVDVQMRELPEILKPPPVLLEENTGGKHKKTRSLGGAEVSTKGEKELELKRTSTDGEIVNPRRHNAVLVWGDKAEKEPAQPQQIDGGNPPPEEVPTGENAQSFSLVVYSGQKNVSAWAMESTGDQQLMLLPPPPPPPPPPAKANRVSSKETSAQISHTRGDSFNSNPSYGYQVFDETSGIKQPQVSHEDSTTYISSSSEDESDDDDESTSSDDTSVDSSLTPESRAGVKEAKRLVFQKTKKKKSSRVKNMSESQQKEPEWGSSIVIWQGKSEKSSKKATSQFALPVQQSAAPADSLAPADNKEIEGASNTSDKVPAVQNDNSIDKENLEDVESKKEQVEQTTVQPVTLQKSENVVLLQPGRSTPIGHLATFAPQDNNSVSSSQQRGRGATKGVDIFAGVLMPQVLNRSDKTARRSQSPAPRRSQSPAPKPAVKNVQEKPVHFTFSTDSYDDQEEPIKPSTATAPNVKDGEASNPSVSDALCDRPQLGKDAPYQQQVEQMPEPKARSLLPDQQQVEQTPEPKARSLFGGAFDSAKASFQHPLSPAFSGAVNGVNRRVKALEDFMKRQGGINFETRTIPVSQGTARTSDDASTTKEETLEQTSSKVQKDCESLEHNETMDASSIDAKEMANAKEMVARENPVVPTTESPPAEVLRDIPKEEEPFEQPPGTGESSDLVADLVEHLRPVVSEGQEDKGHLSTANDESMALKEGTIGIEQQRISDTSGNAEETFSSPIESPSDASNVTKEQVSSPLVDAFGDLENAIEHIGQAVYCSSPTNAIKNKQKTSHTDTNRVVNDMEKLASSMEQFAASIVAPTKSADLDGAVASLTNTEKIENETAGQPKNGGQADGYPSDEDTGLKATKTKPVLPSGDLVGKEDDSSETDHTVLYVKQTCSGNKAELSYRKEDFMQRRAKIKALRQRSGQEEVPTVPKASEPTQKDDGAPPATTDNKEVENTQKDDGAPPATTDNKEVENTQKGDAAPPARTDNKEVDESAKPVPSPVVTDSKLTQMATKAMLRSRSRSARNSRLQKVPPSPEGIRRDPGTANKGKTTPVAKDPEVATLDDNRDPADDTSEKVGKNDAKNEGRLENPPSPVNDAESSAHDRKKKFEQFRERRRQQNRI